MILDPPADGAIFDLDGVIIDSRAPVRTALNAALGACGFARRSPRELDRFIGPPLFAALSELTGEPEYSDAVAECAATYRRAYEQVYLAMTTLVPGVAEVLAAADVPLALATSKHAKFVAPLLERFELGGRFAAVCGSEGAESKVAIVARALDRLGRSHPVLVGDTVFDVEAGHKNTIRVVAVTWGIGARDELADAEVLLDAPNELLALLSSGYGG